MYITTETPLGLGHNPYFNRWFSAIKLVTMQTEKIKGHNPYFNRWFSAIKLTYQEEKELNVTILILIDGFLQYKNNPFLFNLYPRHNPYFNRWFSAMLSSKRIPSGVKPSQSLF